MARITLEHVTVDLPIYNARARFLRHVVMSCAVGGRINIQDNSRVIVRALDGICLDFLSGQRIGLIGHNGAGKSTLLRTIAGLCEPTAGRVVTCGRLSSLLSLHALMDMEMTGNENIDHVGALMGFSPHRWAGLRRDIADFTELGPFLDLPLRTYSSGMQMRLSFALLTSQEPEILLLDEGIGAGDAHFAKSAGQRMRAMAENSNIVVVASHSRAVLQEMCSHVLWLDHGTVRAFGAAAEILEAYGQSTKNA